MLYTEEDINYIKNLLYKCVAVKKDNIIYYIITPNIVRQLKYNRLFNKKEINIDINECDFYKYAVLEQILNDNILEINHDKIYLYFGKKYGYNYNINCYIINNILCNILNLDVNVYRTI